jgi:hypothetical protein
LHQSIHKTHSLPEKMSERRRCTQQEEALRHIIAAYAKYALIPILVSSLFPLTYPSLLSRITAAAADRTCGSGARLYIEVACLCCSDRRVPARCSKVLVSYRVLGHSWFSNLNLHPFLNYCGRSLFIYICIIQNIILNI